ncbi:hypothetical protein CS063_11330 [Sporanaerobium hydrogeniformans]|uniref:Uncharacterized protein n=1 Tax=Sporanaerobium hydrogeniformans TaxID=3072179 RepID=A0AC61DC04_9FIRM|nr:extracellular solute-binding protein [Sporanaerobium hydrogeniformans]PHV70253.1 hypothetical protein CS063_11330 [Sporanaerobium hydrogeniformans]
MKSKKLLGLLMGSALVVSTFTGCGNSGGSEQGASAQASQTGDKVQPADTETSQAEKVTLTMLIDTDITLKGFQEVAKLAEEKLGISVEIETRPGGADGDTLVKTRLASGDMADICLYNSGALLSALNPAEYFLDLSSQDWIDRLDETYRKTVSIDGATYGVPYSSSQAGAILYSKPLYEELGLKVPNTWDEFIANCDVIKAAGKTAIVGTFADSWTAQVLYLGDHYNVLAGDPTFPEKFEAGEAKYATNSAALRSWEKLVQTSPYYNSDYLATTYDDGCDIMANAEAGHWVMLTQALSNIYELYGDKVNDIGVFGIPGDTDTGLTAWMPSSFYVNKNSDKVEDVLRFLEFYTTEEALDAYTSAVLPDGPYCIKNYQIPENGYDAVKEDMQAYFDAGKTSVALEFQTAVKGPNCPAICQEAVLGQKSALDYANAYDADCLKQAVQLGLNWK